MEGKYQSINELRHLEFISPSGVKVILVRKHIRNNLWGVSGELVLPVFSDLYTYADSLAEALKEGLEDVSVKIVQKEFARVIIVDLPSTVKGKGLDDDFYFNEEERGIISKIANSAAIVDITLSVRGVH